MERPNYTQDYDKVLRQLYNALIFLASMAVVLSAFLIYYGLTGNPFASWKKPETIAQKNTEASQTIAVAEMDERIENGIHLGTGLAVAEGFEVVRANCTVCHSGHLVAQNRATRDGWQEMIRWMQRTQGLWQLGDKEAVILDYLAANYAPQEMGRRANLNLEAIEWYILEE
ncbi:MAG: hypothetical protein KDD02_18690 [Phaeodactylibacter sp.]|nr:hypothetical protein [Phaeodactylibacter sp.]MCB9300325.1 hypothetical protein [Lewinellaceae bacterium]